MSLLRRLPQSTRQVAGGLLLGALVAGLAWYNLRQQVVVERPTTAQVDQSFRGFTAVQYDAAGQSQWQLTGQALEHLRQHGGYRITQPEILFSDSKQPGPPWVLSAPKGVADNNLTQVVLSGGVNGKRAPWSDHGQLNLRTEQLTIAPKQRQAHSDVATVFSETRPSSDKDVVWRSRSNGFSLDYDQQILQQSRVDDWLAPKTARHPEPTVSKPANTTP